MPVTLRVLIVLAVAASALVAAASAQATFPGPNGKIAFVKNADIYSVNPDGSGLQQLTKTSSIDEAHPAFSPDGNYIAFTRLSGSQLFIMRSDGSELHWVTNASDMAYLAWSPDGTKIAMFRYASSGRGIWDINRDGSGLTNLITDDSLGPVFSWSPDGSKLAISRGAFQEIWTMNADGTGLTRLTSSASGVSNFSPNWSPDGSTIVFSSDRDCVQCATSDIYAIPSAGGVVSRLTNIPGAQNVDAVWSPDGGRIVFASCVDTGVDCTHDLYVMNADGSGLTVLQNAPEDEAEPNWQPAVGPPLPPIPEALEKIAFESPRNHPGIPGSDDIFTTNPDGTGQRALMDSTSFDGDPAWSPTGSKIAFATDRDNNAEIYVMNADGSGQTNLTHTPVAGEGEPTWSPDGNSIAYSSNDGSDHIGLWVMSSDGTAQRQLTAGPRDLAPSWSPAGTKIAFRHAGAIYTIKPDATGLTQITTAPSNGRDDFPDWSPDGSKIAFSRFLPVGGGTVSNIWTMNADGSAQQQITNVSTGAVFPSWSPDGTKIAFDRTTSDRFEHVFVMNSDGTGVVQITNLPFGPDTAPDWRPVAGYPRPRGATPLRLALVPAYSECTAPNDTHGAPLSNGSCAPPQLTSSQLTVGTPDSNGKRTTMEAYIQLTTIVGSPSTPADVQITAALQDVFRKDLSDYTGQLRAELPVRITDRNNMPSPGGTGAATTVPFLFGYDVPCTATPADATVGSDCTLTTTVNTLYPGAIVAGKRAIWQMGRGRIDDSGPDGNPGTTDDNTVLLDQGVFVP